MFSTSGKVWAEALVFLTVFVLVNSVIMLVFWFSYAITSSNRVSGINFAVFGTGDIVSGRRTTSDQKDQQNKTLSQDDMDAGPLVTRSSYLASPRNSSSSDRSSISNLELNSSSDEEAIACMSVQALSSTTQNRFSHRISRLQGQVQVQEATQSIFIPVGILMILEYEDAAEFTKLLTRLSQEAKKSHSVAVPEHQALHFSEFKEFVRYHTLVPVRRFDPSFLHLPEPGAPST